jgi:signal transduction histidine kinase
MRGGKRSVDKYIDKVTVFILCAVFFVQYRTDFYSVVPLIIVVIVGAFMSYIEDDRVRLAAALVYFAAAFYYPDFVFFLPVICCDIYFSRYGPAALAAVVPLVAGFTVLPLLDSIFICLFAGLSLLMRRRTVMLDKLRSEYVALRDSTKEFSLQLEHKNKELMEKQDYEIHLATLGERNRIARDIHDSVGHLLSNSILQTGALLATCADDGLREKLATLNKTLMTGMETVRSSIHDLYEESVDLYAEIKTLCDGFDFCPVTLEYDMDSSPDKKIKYALLSVVKEALSNIIRHSDASLVTVAMREHPALFQLIIRDNGSKKAAAGEGLGLKNIEQRIGSLGGLSNIGYDNGFTVFVTIPKTPSEN